MCSEFSVLSTRTEYNICWEVTDDILPDCCSFLLPLPLDQHRGDENTVSSPLAHTSSKIEACKQFRQFIFLTEWSTAPLTELYLLACTERSDTFSDLTQMYVQLQMYMQLKQTMLNIWADLSQPLLICFYKNPNPTNLFPSFLNSHYKPCV